MTRESGMIQHLPQGMSISVVVPVYNSASTLPRLTQELKVALEAMKSDFEVILVNDGSKDLTSQMITDLAQQHDFIIGLDLARNYGQHNALLCGIRHASKKIVVTLDDDLQTPPSEMYKLLSKLNEGYDVVYGVREKETHSFLRNLASLTTKYVLQKAMGAQIARDISSYKAFRTDLRDSFTDFRSPYVCIDILLTWATTNFGAVQVKHVAREQGESNYTLGKLIVHALNLITGFTVLPLQFASMTGFVLLFFGICGVIYVVGKYLLGWGYVPGFSFLACAILIFSAAQLLALGIIGEYLARMYCGAMGKPLYMVKINRKSGQVRNENGRVEEHSVV